MELSNSVTGLKPDKNTSGCDLRKFLRPENFPYEQSRTNFVQQFSWEKNPDINLLTGSVDELDLLSLLTGRLIHSDDGLKLETSVFECFHLRWLIYLIDLVVDN